MNNYMTFIEAISQALEKLGGRATLSDIYLLVGNLKTDSGSSDVRATIRTTLQRHPLLFRRSPGKPDGWWELMSFQEEIAVRDARIAELEALVEELESTPKEDAFVKKMVIQAKRMFKRKREVADELRNLFIKVDRSDAANDIDCWLDENERMNSLTINGPLNDIHDNEHVNAGL